MFGDCCFLEAEMQAAIRAGGEGGVADEGKWEGHEREGKGQGGWCWRGSDGAPVIMVKCDAIQLWDILCV